MIPQPITLIMVIENRVVTTTLDDLLYRYQPTRLRQALEANGVPLNCQPPSVREGVKLLARRWGYLAS